MKVAAERGIRSYRIASAAIKGRLPRPSAPDTLRAMAIRLDPNDRDFGPKMDALDDLRGVTKDGLTKARKEYPCRIDDDHVIAVDELYAQVRVDGEPWKICSYCWAQHHGVKDPS